MLLYGGVLQEGRQGSFSEVSVSSSNQCSSAVRLETIGNLQTCCAPWNCCKCMFKSHACAFVHIQICKEMENGEKKNEREKICLYFYLVLYKRLLGPWITERLSIITPLIELQNKTAAVVWKKSNLLGRLLFLTSVYHKMFCFRSNGTFHFQAK